MVGYKNQHRTTCAFIGRLLAYMLQITNPQSSNRALDPNAGSQTMLCRPNDHPWQTRPLQACSPISHTDSVRTSSDGTHASLCDSRVLSRSGRQHVRPGGRCTRQCKEQRQSVPTPHGVRRLAGLGPAVVQVHLSNPCSRLPGSNTSDVGLVNSLSTSFGSHSPCFRGFRFLLV